MSLVSLSECLIFVAVTLFMVVRVSRAFLSVVGLGLDCFHSRIPCILWPTLGSIALPLNIKLFQDLEVHGIQVILVRACMAFVSVIPCLCSLGQVFRLLTIFLSEVVIPFTGDWGYIGRVLYTFWFICFSLWCWVIVGVLGGRRL